jgi:hypothetical protein
MPSSPAKLVITLAGVAALERFVVTQEHEEAWVVQHREIDLYRYPTQAEAELAALALANDATQRGSAATVLILPATDVTVEVDRADQNRRYSGM